MTAWPWVCRLKRRGPLLRYHGFMRILFIILSAILAELPLFGCDCRPSKAATFEETVDAELAAAAKRNVPARLAVVEAEVVEVGEIVVGQYPPPVNAPRTQPRMKLRVAANRLQTPASPADGAEVSVVGQDGLNCNAPLKPFVPGNRYLFALFADYETPGLYQLSACRMTKPRSCAA